jgi:hypothetical protein
MNGFGSNCFKCHAKGQLAGFHLCHDGIQRDFSYGNDTLLIGGFTMGSATGALSLSRFEFRSIVAPATVAIALGIVYLLYWHKVPRTGNQLPE